METASAAFSAVIRSRCLFVLRLFDPGRRSAVGPRNNAAQLLPCLDDFARHIYDLGFGAVEWLLDYLILGAMLVVPIWLLIEAL